MIILLYMNDDNNWFIKLYWLLQSYHVYLVYEQHIHPT